VPQAARARTHPFGWIVAPLREEPSFVERAMFGARGVYLHGRLVLVLAARGREPWQGVLVPTERDHHPPLRRSHPSLVPHPVLGKWLYLPEASDDFEETAAALADAARAGDPRLGVEPSRGRARRG
jgi:hypothetical protein